MTRVFAFFSALSAAAAIFAAEELPKKAALGELHLAAPKVTPRRNTQNGGEPDAGIALNNEQPASGAEALNAGLLGDNKQPSAPVAPLPVPPRVPANAASVERGKALYGRSCAACHGADGRAQNRYDDQSGRQVAARDLTAPWTFRGGSEPAQIWLRLTTGMALSAMPSYADTLTPAERWDIVNYVLSLARVPPWEPGDRPRHLFACLAAPGLYPKPGLAQLCVGNRPTAHLAHNPVLRYDGAPLLP